MDKSQIVIGLEEEREQLKIKLQSLDVTILMFKQSMNIPTSNDNEEANTNHVNGHIEPSLKELHNKYKGYLAAKSNKEKVAIILRTEAKFLHMRQIVRTAQSLEPKINQEDLAKRIGQAVYGLKNDEKLVSKSIGKTNLNTFYGSKSWVDEIGDIKPEFIYDEAELVTNKVENIEI